MFQFFGYVGALLMGLSLGLVGGGGSIIALPILVYLFFVSPELAIAYSLFIVGATSVFASINYIKQKNFDLGIAIRFGIPSLIAVAIARSVIMPNVPKVLFHVSGIDIKKPIVLLLLFSILMLVVSIKMIIGKQKKQGKDGLDNASNLTKNGLGVGFLTGFIGAGGGFLIVPALVNNAGANMKKAIGTSLIIIGINSLIGFAISAYHISKIDWTLLLTFLAVSFVGTFAGAQLSKLISNERLKPIFGWFVLVTGIYIVIKEFFFHH